ncbi:MAG: DNA polymerase Y family protein [Burkholderiales bacterium]|nr:DNA polymerase Y family protein [Burkholderiales bacterium]
MLWLALHLPSVSLEAFCATLTQAQSAAATLPVALVAEHRITGCNAAAADRGIRAGMKRPTAQSLTADLLLGEADAARDAAALRSVAHAALAFTPAVTLQEGQATVLMEVQASLRLFGGLAALRRLVLEALAPLMHRVQIAAAPTALGAAALARWGAEAAATAADTAAFDPVLGPHATSLRELARLLDQAPVWLLGPAREHWEALQGMGLRTLADLRELPRSGLARRFGEGLLQDLDRALGRAPDPRRWLELPTRFETRLELHQRADSTEQVLAAAAVLLARLVVWAQARHGRIAAFTLAMLHEPRHQGRGGALPDTELRIELAEPALDATHLQLLLRERLARVLLAAPTLELRLRCRELASGAPPNGELFPTRGSEALGLARLLERLRARLGDAQVQRLEPVADHRPERSSRGVPALAAEVRTLGEGARRALPQQRVSSIENRTQPLQLQSSIENRKQQPLLRPIAIEDRPLPLHRPVWLLPEPVPLPERHALPLLDGQPLQLVSGPERIEAGWWDGAPAARDYFIALAADGSLVWVWRGRLPSISSAHEHGGGGADVQWMLQGRFA